MAAADYIPNLVEEVLAWQSNVGTQRIPNKHSKDTTEAKLGRRFEKLLLRRSRALGRKPSGRQLEPTEVALVNSVPGVPARGCSVHGWRETEPCDLSLVEETEPQVRDPEIDVGMARCTMSTVDIWLQFPADIIARLGELQVAEELGRTSRWLYFMIASAILLEDVQDVQKRSFRTLAIEIVKKIRPHVLERLHTGARNIMMNVELFSFLIFWRVDRDARGNAILVRDGPPAPARNALSENGVEFLKEELDTTLDHTQHSMLFHEGCVAIWARDYAWFLSDAQIPELEDVSEEDVGSEEDSEEDREFTTRLAHVFRSRFGYSSRGFCCQSYSTAWLS